MLTKIISGGQTGADIAGVDAAIANDFPYGGTLPKGRKQELGQTVPATYTEFVESISADYNIRTKQNVDDSDGTVVFHRSSLTGGTRLTVRLTFQCNKPCFVVNLDDYSFHEDAAEEIMQWVLGSSIKVLNVAGPRASKNPNIYDDVGYVIGYLLTLNRSLPSTIL